MSMMHLGKLREWSGLTQKEVCVLIQLHTGEHYGFEAISRHESNNPTAFRTPPANIIRAYATIYKVPVQYLYTELIEEDRLRAFVAQERGLVVAE